MRTLVAGLITLSALLQARTAAARREAFAGDGLVRALADRALGPAAPALDPIRIEIMKNKDVVEARAQDEVQRHANFREIRGFYIDYQTMRCVPTPHFGIDTGASARVAGECVAKAHAYQITADVALNVSSAGITVRALGAIVD